MIPIGLCNFIVSDHNCYDWRTPSDNNNLISVNIRICGIELGRLKKPIGSCRSKVLSKQENRFSPDIFDLPKLDALENFVEENSATHEFSLLTKFSEMADNLDGTTARSEVG